MKSPPPSPGQSPTQILADFRDGKLGADAALVQLDAARAQTLTHATIDHDRARRCGVPEVIYGAGKTAEQVVEIAGRLLEQGGHALVTRATAEHDAALRQAFSGVAYETAASATGKAGTVLLGEVEEKRLPAVPIVTAGTSDLPVADEARLTCKALGQPTTTMTDVGVAGVHRLLARAEELRQARVLVCIAGMEGALPSVVGGLVDCPVIAVPTSVGYGAAFEGVAALLGMLTSCASGVVTVNIDNGFGAAYAACRINVLGGLLEADDEA